MEPRGRSAAHMAASTATLRLAVTAKSGLSLATRSAVITMIGVRR